jgi:hypothetical protein
MLPSTMICDWARHLLASQSAANTNSDQTEPDTVLVYEKLRSQLSISVGTEGFHALASRALALAKCDEHGLSAVQITADGRLRGFAEPTSQTGPAQDGEPGVMFIAHLLGLFLTFLGAATTQRLVQDIFPALDVPLEPDAVTPFDIILQEVSQLRSVTERLTSLAARNPDVEEGLMTISENIRDIATILDVFVVVKDRPAGQLTEQTSEYLM